MANRYWVGGTGTWDATTTTNWASASNGTAGASAPTSVDSVFFDSSSNATAYTVTIGTNAAALDVSIVGPASGSVTITSSATSVLNVYGSWSNAATGVVFSTTTGAIINFLATTTGKTVTTNNITLGGMTVIFNGVGGGWTLGSAFTHTQVFTVTAGTFNTGNFTLVSGGFSSSGTGVRSITLGTSTVTLSGSAAWTLTTTTNLTFSGASSTINCSGTTATFAGGSLTYNVVNFTNVTGATHNITGTNTFATLSFTSRTTDGLVNIILANNQTITGTLTLGAGNTAIRRVFVQSTTIGIQRTLTVATVATLADVDFADTIAAGASGTWSGTRLGNCKNNSNITFPTAKTVYFSSSAGASANWASASWASSSGGADFSANNFPLAQDTAVIDDAGATTGNGLRTGNTITLGFSWNIGSFLSTRTAAYIFAQSNNDPTIYGDFTLSSGISITVLTSPTWTFSGQGVTQNITTAGKIINATNTSVVSPGGIVKLLDSWTQEIPSGATNATFTLNAGTLDLNGFTLTANSFSNSNSNVRTLAFGTTGKIVLFGSGGTTYSGSVTTNLTVSGTAPLVQFTYSGATGSRNIVMSSVPESQAISVEFLNNATDAVVIQGVAGGYKNITFTSFSGTISTANSPNVFGNLYLCSGITSFIGNSTVTFAATSGTQTITTAGPTPVTLDFPITKTGAGILQLQTSVTMGSTRIFTLTTGTLDLNNLILTSGLFSSSGTSTRSIAFGSSGKLVLTSNSGVICNTDTATSLTLTGTPRVELYYTGGVGTRNIYAGITGGVEANSFNYYVTGNGTDTVSFLGTNRKYGTIDLTAFSGYLQSDNWQYTIYGNLVLSAGLLGFTTSSTFTGPIVFGATSSTKTITSAGKTLPVGVTFNGVGGTWSLQDNLTIQSTITTTLTNGTLDLNSLSLTTGLFSSNNSNTRTLAFNGGSYVLTGTTWDVGGTGLTISNVSNTGTIEVSSSSLTFNGGGYTYPTLKISSATTTVITGANTFYKLTNTAVPVTITLPASIITTIINVDVSGSSSGYVTLNSSTSGTQATIAIPDASQASENYLSLQDINISTNSGLLYAGPNSVIGTNVTGVSTSLGEFLSFF